MNEIPKELLTDKLKKRMLKRTEEVDGCLLWTGQLQQGRGYVLINGRRYTIARLVYSINKKIRRNQIVRQTCGNQLCIKPSHLKQDWEELTVFDLE